ncbi:MAG: T9SS type A sorting domain-containing protein [Chitinophagales bacterium]|nr:T9SS type A sorting domain-containing protein [Chitinophagales bacterium]MDW8394544.1 T9SS type A sorting domain-containing protein [Chitinophagales bacterium]
MKSTYVLLACLLSIPSLLIASTRPAPVVYGYMENKGQIVDQNDHPRPDILFMYVDDGFRVHLRTTGFSYEWIQTNYVYGNGYESGELDLSYDNDEMPDYPVEFVTHRVDVEFVGANPGVTIYGNGVSPFYRNYFNHLTGPQGITCVRNYEEVIYKNLYEGIDLVFRTTKHNDGNYYPEYRFLVHPQGNPADIQLQYRGMDQITLADNGSLHLSGSLGHVYETRPVILNSDGSFRQIANFQLKNSRLSFSGIKRKKDETIVIDPTILWSTYWGGTAKDVTDEIEIDSSGYCYVTGRTRSVTNYATSGAYLTVHQGGNDVPLMKWAPDGNLVYATYYGGKKNEIGFNITVDHMYNIWIGGHTFSTTGIATPNALQTFFVTGNDDDYNGLFAKFNPEGFLVYGTYLGGVGQTKFQNLWPDTDGSIYCSGFSEALTNVIYSPCWDCTGDTSGAVFVMKFDNDGNQIWANYWGGDQRDRGHGIVVHNNNVYQTATVLSKVGIAYGNPGGNAFDTSNDGLNDMMLARWNKMTGEPIWVSYFGGTGDERARDIRCDRYGYLYFTGQTESGLDGLATPGAWKTSFIYTPDNRDGIVAKFDSNCNKIWCTYFGGNNIDFPRSLRVRPEGAPVYIGGYTKSDSFFVTKSTAYDKKLGKPNDAFWLRFNHDGSVLQYSTYFGGKKKESITEPGWYGPTMTLDADNNVFLSSCTSSPDAIAVNAYKSYLEQEDEFDFFVAKFADPCPDGFEPNGSFAQATQLYFPKNNIIVHQAPIQEKNDKDYYTFTTSGTNNNLKIVLSNQPVDLNLFLYDNNNKEISKVKNGSTADDVIVVNNTYIGKYSIMVKSNNTSFAEGSCYMLTVEMNPFPFRLPEDHVSSSSGLLTVYPNPASDQVELSLKPFNGYVVIEFIDLSGKIHCQNRYETDGSSSFTIPVNQLPQGVYVLRVRSAEFSDQVLVQVQR